MIPTPDPDDEWIDSDEYDAIAIHDMAVGFEEEDMLPDEPFTSIPSAWAQVQPHPETGTMIQFCWENPAAWRILDGDVDRAWFVEQLLTHDVEPQPMGQTVA